MISVVYAVHNEEEMLPKSLASVVDFADEIIIVDGESTDQTVAIAKKFKAKVIETTNKANFHINKQLAIDQAKGELILQLDADEVVDVALQKFILQTAAAGQKEIAAWYIRRKNLFFKTWLRKGGQYPDPVIRLFWRGQAYLPQQDVHEQMTVVGKVGTARGHLLHFANPTLACYLRKFNTYTSFKAQQLVDQGLKPTFGHLVEYTVIKPLVTFGSLYLRHRGYVDGRAGFLFAKWSGLHHQVAYNKYLEMIKELPTPKLTVFYPQSPVAAAQAHRGVGRYEAWLRQSLAANSKIDIGRNQQTAAVIHYPFFDLWRPSLQLGKKGQRVIVTVHDVVPLLFPQDYPAGMRGRYHFWGQQRRLKKVDLVVTDSLASKQDLIDKLSLKENKVQVVPLAANPALHPASLAQQQQVRRKYNLPKNYLLYVGDINFNKNLSQLIKALKFLPDNLQLVLLGKNFVPRDIPEWRTIEEQINMSAVTNRVHFLTRVTDDEELAAIYSGAAVYVQPSYYEGFGLPVLEAMRCQTPVVCPHNSALAEIGNKYVTYSDGLTALDLATAIQKVLALSTAARRRLVKSAAVWQEKFSWDKVGQQMAAIYEQI